ncbi:helix-turn-helix domain-containing protein [Sphingomonas sp. I4]
MNETLANDLKAARVAAGLTQGGLAEAIGVSRKTINTVENGVFQPSTLLAPQAGARAGPFGRIAVLDRRVTTLIAAQSDRRSATAD